MASSKIILSVLVVAAVVAICEAANSCPLASKVYGCSPKCMQDYDCSHGKKCCQNSCNAKSCVEPASGSDGGSNKYSSGGTGTYCNNVKCNSFEVCKLDPSTKRMKCSRA